MGAYLSEPNLSKISNDCDNDHISYGASSMQGWRVTQEDAHNSISDFDANSSLFAVYDGHGGVEVATYCSKYLPGLLKSLDDYKNGNIEEALKKAFLKIDEQLITEEAKKELNFLAGNSESEDKKKKEATEDETKVEGGGESEDEGNEVEKLYDEATMPLYEVLKRYTKTKNRVKKQLDANRAKLGLESVKSEEEEGEKGAAVGSSHNEIAKEENVDGEEEEDSDVNFKLEDIKMFKKFALNRIKKMANKRLENAEKNENESVAADAAVGEEEKTEDADDDEDDDDDDDEDDEDEEAEDVNDGDFLGDDDDEDDDEDEEDDDDEEEADEDDEDELIESDGNGEPGFDSGCTAVVALVHENKLYVANAGDSRCVICRGGKAIDMSIDHKPEDEDEKKRIESAGGRVTLDGRVNGGLNLSRALGDHTYKKNKELGLENQMISSLPDIKTLDLEESDEFMILACDGIWNSMTSQECVDYVRERLNIYPKLSQIIEELFMHCLAPNCNGDGTGCDNMTCQIVTFKPYKSNILTTNNSVNSLESIEATAKSDKLSNGNSKQPVNNLKRPLNANDEAVEAESSANTDNKKIKINSEDDEVNV